MTRRHDSKISAIFWGILTNFPFILLFLSFLTTFAPFSDNSTPFSFSSFTEWLSSFVLSFEFSFSLADALIEFFNLIVGLGTLSPFIISFVLLIIYFLCYYVIIHLLRIIIDVVLFVPHLFHSWISKFDRKVE